MKKLIVIVLVFAGFLYWFNDFSRTGKLEKYLDAHPNASLNSRIEYCLAVLTDIANKNESAEIRYRRIITIYPDTSITPSAWVKMIELIDKRNDRNLVLLESAGFLEKYPNDQGAAIIRRKVEVIKHGY